MTDNKDKSALDAYWRRYKQVCPEETAKTYASYYFCDNEADARELADLVVAGVKRATTSLLAAFEREGEPLPKPGDCAVITDYHGSPRCVVKTIGVDVLPFSEVTEAFARTEGEGDGSLAYWREGHIRFFSRDCEAMGTVFSQDMPVVCERFEVVFR